MTTHSAQQIKNRPAADGPAVFHIQAYLLMAMLVLPAGAARAETVRVNIGGGNQVPPPEGVV